MLNIYLDTSALIKLFILEEDSLQTWKFVQSSDNTSSSAITFVEMRSALAKLVRTKSITAQEAQLVWEEFLHWWPKLQRIPVDAPLLTSAAHLAWEYHLRAYDAVHLACAITWQTLLGYPITLATFDHALWKASQAAGLQVWPDELRHPKG